MSKATGKSGARFTSAKPIGNRPVHKITYQGTFLKWQWPSLDRPPPPPGVRGEVTHFSQDARFRMFAMMNKIDWSKVGKSLFITVTYPDECFPKDKYVINKQRARLARHIEKHAGKHVGILWRIEWQNRKSGKMKHHLYPHIHLIVFDVRFIHYEKVRTWWRTIIGYKGHKKVRTETKEAKGKKDCINYVAKYNAKLDSLVIGPYLNNPHKGRQWGLLRKNALPWGDIHYCESTWTPELETAYEAGRPEEVRNEFGNLSYTRFGEKASEVGQFMFGTGLAGELHEV